MVTEITLQELADIYQLFESKKWPIDEDNKSSLFNRFRRTYEKFDDGERKLFINLSYQYEIVTLNQYQELLRDVLLKAVKNHLSQKQTIYVYPIKKKEHHGSVKSADLVTYLCNGTHVKYSDALSKKTFLCLGSLERVEERRANIVKNKLIIVDDFIGTGNYATEVVNEIVALGIPTKQIVIVTLFVTQEALDRLQQLDCGIEYGKIIESCINRLTPSEKVILKRMEQKIGITEQFHFGYCQSGTLISLIRTPNNTLPIFWQANGRAYTPPFPR